MTIEDDPERVEASIVSEVFKATKDDPQVKEAAGNLGQTAVTVTKTINNVLLPIAAVNFAFDKARVYFERQFQMDLNEKVSSIPSEHVVEPKASVAGPALQGLAFTHEEPSLKELYLSLLRTHLLNVTDSLTEEAVEIPQMAVMIDNWIRLGLIEVSYGQWLTGGVKYDWAYQRPEYLKLKEEHEVSGIKVSPHNGYLLRTQLGHNFAKAVGIIGD